MIKYYETYDKKWFLQDSKLCYVEAGSVHIAENSDALNLLNPNDMCMGIIGDGCGGGRLFIADTGHGMIKVYDPQTAEIFIILQDLNMPKKIEKKGCILSIETATITELIEFDLSSMSQTIKRL